LVELASGSIIGISATLAIEQLITKLKGSGTIIKLIDQNKGSRSEFSQLGMLDLIGEKNCMSDFREAVDSVERSRIL